MSEEQIKEHVPANGLRTSTDSSGTPRLWVSDVTGSEQLQFPWKQEQQQKKSFFSKLWLKGRKSYQQKLAEYTWLDWLQMFLPCVRWLRTYNLREWLLADLIAGISVGFMVVPQAMSYANLAGLPSVYGLYGAFLPVIAYSLLGSSKHLAVGPVAVTSLLIGTALSELVEGADKITNPNSVPPELESVQEAYNMRAIQLSFLVAILYTSVGVFRFGFITNFLSHSVIGGFTSGAAIIIGLSQFKYLVGYNIPKQDQLHHFFRNYIHGLPDFKWQEFVMGSTLLVVLITFKELGKRVERLKWLRPLGPITACIISLCAVYIGHVDKKGIRIIKQIPKGLPGPTIDWWVPMPDFIKLLPTALVVWLVDLMESTSIARALAGKAKYELDTNLEITGLGIANFAGAAFNAYTTTGSFSRSAVNFDSGAKTGLSGFVTAWVVGFVLLFLTPVFEKLPYNTLGAIVISGVTGLLEYEQAIYLFKVNKLDWLVWMASFLGCLFISIEIGLGISVGLALIIVIYESAFPHTAMLGRIPGSRVYRNVKQYPDAQMVPGILAVRIDAPLYFANVQWVKDRVHKYAARAATWSKEQGVRLQFVCLDMTPMTHIDATGVHALEALIGELRKEDVQLVLSNPNSKVIQALELAGVPEFLGREWIFVTIHDAVMCCGARMQELGAAAVPLQVPAGLISRENSNTVARKGT